MQVFTAIILSVFALYLGMSFNKNGQVEGRGLSAREQYDNPLKGSHTYALEGSRMKRSSGYIISDCITVTSEEGKYYYKAHEESSAVCGVYFLTDPDKIIEIHFNYIDVPCETGGRVSIVDGWELDGEYFPSIDEHRRTFEDRYYELCGTKRVGGKKTLLTSQNAGLVQYKLPMKNTAFSFSVRFLKTNTPCNILNEGQSEVYTLRNYGKSYNCSFISITPAKVKILAMSVGMVGPINHFEVETGSLHKCSRRGAKDVVLIGGNEGLDTKKMTPVIDTCGIDSRPQPYDVVIACNMTTVKLISSGEWDNSVTFMISPVDEEDLLSSSLICGL